MRPKKGTKAYKSEYVTVYMGINMLTFAVESVWESRDGTLSGPNGGSAHTGSHRPGQGEATIVFNLTNVQSLPVYLYESHASRIRKELEEKAAVMRAESEAKKTDDSDTLASIVQTSPLD